MILFGFCAIITLWCAGFTVYLAVPHSVAGWKDLPQYVPLLSLNDKPFITSASLIQTNATFRDIVISLVATYGLYLIGSIIHGEPWHMFTSFIQYLFLQPSCECAFVYHIPSRLPDRVPIRHQHSQ